MTNRQTELLIQKCVDGELSPEETRAFLQQLDSQATGWKQLACGLLEDRNFSRAIGRSGAVASEPSPRKPVRVPAETYQSQHQAVQSNSKASSANRLRAWYAHPLTSLSLCAAIAFVGGLLIPDFQHGGSPNRSSNLASATLPGEKMSPLVQSAQSVGGYRVEMQPGGRRVEVPVVSELNELYQLDRNHPLFSDSNGERDNVRWMLVPVEGDRSMLIPVSEDSAMDMQ